MNEIFSVVSSAREEARAWGSVILAGKCCSRRHSTTSFSESVACELQTFLLARLHLSLCDLLSFVCHSMRHQHGISVAESQTFLLAKRPSAAMSEEKLLPFAG